MREPVRANRNIYCPYCYDKGERVILRRIPAGKSEKGNDCFVHYCKVCDWGTEL